MADVYKKMPNLRIHVHYIFTILMLTIYGAQV